jgi:hypothetical protein
VTQIGLEVIAAAFAYGAAAVRVILRAKPRHDLAGLYNTIALAKPILAGLGLPGERLATIETDDPFALGEALRAIEPGEPVSRPATFQPVGGKRDVLRFALQELHRVAPAARRHHRAAHRGALRRRRDQCRGLHALPVLCLRVPDRRAVG